jgi:hypothetical protein
MRWNDHGGGVARSKDKRHANRWRKNPTHTLRGSGLHATQNTEKVASPPSESTLKKTVSKNQEHTNLH